MNNNDSINIAAVVKLFSGNEAMALNLINEFLMNLDQECQPISEAFDEKQEENFIRAVHRLAGACAYVGAERLWSLSKQLEKATREQGLAQVSPLYKDLLHEVELVKKYQLPN